MTFEFKLPDIGEGVVEGEIVKWLVKAGDRVDVDQPMVEVMTDKATVVIPSPKRGVVKETRGREGDVVQVHAILVVIDDAGAKAEPRPIPIAPETSVPVATAPTPSPSPSPAAPPHQNGGPKVLAAPATRRLAREMGVELTRVPGTGPAGRVTSDDVRRAAGAASDPQPSHAPPTPPVPAVREAPRSQVVGGGDERIPVRGLRKRIWENMALSAFTAAHFTFVEECDATELVEMRGRFNSRLREGEQKLTYLPFIVKAVISALKRFPMMNGHVDDDQMEFIRRADYHIGIAVASERGLIVPVVKHADRRSIMSLQTEIGRLADAVRSNRLTQDDLGGSTFTITSLGKEGGIFATPIINYPEVAIMGVHKLSKRPMVNDDDQIVIREMMNLSLSFDHRLIDGHVGAAFTYAVIDLLQYPDRLMMEMA